MPAFRPRSWLLAPVLALACASVAFATLPSVGVGASSAGSTVSADVPPAIQLSDQCGVRAAVHFGMVPPGSAVRTTGGASVCRYSFSSSNSSSMLRLYQADTTGQTMVAQPSAWTTIGGASAANYRHLAGFGTSLVYGAQETSADGDYDWSTDGGSTWLADEQGADNFPMVTVASATVAWRFGGNGAQRSSDANANPGPPSWSPVTTNIVGPPTQWSDPDAVDAVDYSTAWMISGATSYRTTSPGAAEPWEASGTGCSNANDIDALDASTVFVAGTGRVCRTTTGPGGWSQITAGLTAGIEINDIEISPETSTTIWSAGARGSLYRSTNNGTNWSPMPVPLPIDIHRVRVLDDDDIMIGGEGGLIYRTTNAGTSWTRIRVPTTTPIYDWHVGSANQMFVGVGGTGVWQTSNGGTTWTNPLTVSSETIVDVDAIDDDVIIAARGNGTVRVTTNGGGAWTTYDTGLAPDNVRGVAVVDRDSFIAVGDRGAVAVSEDAGVSWTTRVSGTNEDLWDVAVQPNGTVLAVGANGTITRSADRGWNWTVRSAAGTGLRKVDIRSGGLALAVGFSGTIRRSTDDGVTWTTPTSGSTQTIASVGIASPTVAYASTSGTLLKSVDGGATWSPIAMTSNFVHMAVVSEDIVYATRSHRGGWTQWATRTIDGGATWQSPFSNNSPEVRTVHAVDGGRVLFAGWNDWVRVTTPGAAVPDYAPGGWGAGTSVFGACMQDVGGAAAESDWDEDLGGDSPGVCEADDDDPWEPIPIAPVKVAEVAGPGTGSVDIVWGFRPAASLTPGEYTAGIVVEAVAPNV